LIWKYSTQLKSIYETPAQLPLTKNRSIDAILTQAKKEKRTILDEYESKKILEAYQIPTVPTEIAHSAEEAAKLAQKIGFPIVLKLYSRTITHKTDVGGVKLNLNDATAVKTAYTEIFNSVKKLAGEEHFQGITVQPMIKLNEGYELILGSSLDVEFG